MYSTEDLQIRGSPIHGHGVFAVRVIPAQTRVLEYVGKRLTKAECEALPDKTYCFLLDEQHALDGAAARWNPAGFINHSCEPNCESRMIEGVIWIVTLRDLAAGEELTYNYGYGWDNLCRHPCSCGAAICVGYIVAERFFPTLRRLREHGELST